MTQKILIGTIVEESSITLSELSRVCCVETDYLIELVTEGILDPISETQLTEPPEQWSFTGNCIKRVHISLRLQQDLELNLAGIALMLDKLES
jgi:chaperone modulatory protein CbpM